MELWYWIPPWFAPFVTNSLATTRPSTCDTVPFTVTLEKGARMTPPHF